MTETGDPLVVADLSLDANYIPDIEPALSEICVPFFQKKRVAGVIDCEGPNREEFGPFELEALTTVAAMVSARLDALAEADMIETQNAALIQSEERLKLALQGTNEGLWDWDVETGKTYYSPRWYTMLGLFPGELPAEHATFQSLLHPDDQASTGDYVKEAFRGSKDQLSSEFRLRHKNGNWVHILSQAKVIWKDGKPSRVIGTHIDTTALKLSEAKLRESERRLREAQRAAKLGWWEIDHAGRLIWSDSVFEIFDVEREEFSGTSREFYERVHPDDIGLVQSTTQDAAEQGKRYECIHRVVHRDGTILTVRETADPQYGANGKLVKLKGTVQDISQQVQDEQRLRTAQRMEAVGHLTGGVAHDFNNLLAVIRGCAELLSSSSDTDRDFIASIIRATDRGAEMTRRLLAYARKQPLAPASVDIAALLNQTTDWLPTALNESIEFDLAVASDL